MVSSSAPPQLNPFYIEPEWQGDWRNDTDYLEEENDDMERLLPRDGHQPQHQYQQHAAAATTNWQHRHPKKKRRVTRLRVGVLCFLLFLLFLALLSMTSSRTTSNEAGTTTDNESISKTTQPSTPPASPLPPTKTPAPSPSSTSNPQRHKIVILGERNSGVKQLEKRLKDCYPHVTISSRLDRDAFWFQDGPPDPSTAAAAAAAAANDDEDELQHFWLIVMVRHPVDWVYEIWKKPSYMPLHTNVTLSEFRTKVWTMPRSKRDESIIDTTTIKCQMHFSHDRVVPCLPDDGLEAVYELNNESKPFSSILALRRAKLLHILNEVPLQWKEYVLNQKEVIVLHYEDTLREHIRILESQTDVTGHVCQDLDFNFPGTSGDVPIEHVQWMNDHVDWKVEAQIGYSPRNATGGTTPGKNETNPSSTPAPPENGTNNTNATSGKNDSHVVQPTDDVSPGEAVQHSDAPSGNANSTNSTAGSEKEKGSATGTDTPTNSSTPSTNSSSKHAEQGNNTAPTANPMNHSSATENLSNNSSAVDKPNNSTSSSEGSGA